MVAEVPIGMSREAVAGRVKHARTVALNMARKLNFSITCACARTFYRSRTQKWSLKCRFGSVVEQSLVAASEWSLNAVQNERKADVVPAESGR